MAAVYFAIFIFLGELRGERWRRRETDGKGEGNSEGEKQEHLSAEKP